LICLLRVNSGILRKKSSLWAIAIAQTRKPSGRCAVKQQKVSGLDVILQIGAHRTASTSFQTYLRQNGTALAQMDIGSWGPYRLGKGLFHGIVPNPALGIGPEHLARAKGKIAMHLDRSALKGLKHLLVSEENMLGKMRHNFFEQALYPAAGERLARYVGAFDGSVKALHISLRCPSTYWTSALSFCIPRGVRVPREKRITALAQSPRTWRNVITDIAAATPDTSIFVSTYEQHASAPQTLLSYLLGYAAPRPKSPIWRNRRPSLPELKRLPLGMNERAQLEAHIHDNRWEPFTPAQRAAFQESYADDLFWLRAGADGLAHLLEDPKPQETGYPAKLDFAHKGHEHDARYRLASPR
jgi:hypothetical protein